ncbi:MAG: hypothetical protein QG673_919 [Pseudomonadota bacterium]|nr:hypothetical protein [Pseudomonadota bacterium]
MNANKKLAYLKLALAIFAWGGVYHTANYMVKQMAPVDIAFLRYLIASVILIVALHKKRGMIIDLTKFKANWLLLVSIGFFGVGLYNLAFFAAETSISANMIAIIFSVTPCLSAFLASIVFKQRVTVFGYIGMVIAICGTIGVIILSEPACEPALSLHSFIHNISLGELYALATSILFAIYSILNKKATIQKIDSLTIIACAAVFGTISLFIFALVLGNLSSIWHNNSIEFWLALLYTSIIGSVYAYFWFSEALAVLGVAKVAVFCNGVPLATVLIGVVLFKQPISLNVVICGMIIIAGVLLTNFVMNRDS